MQNYLPVQPQAIIGSTFIDSIYNHRFPLFVEREQSKELLPCFTVTMRSATRILFRELEIPIPRTMSNPLFPGTVNLMSSRKSWVVLRNRKIIQKITYDDKWICFITFSNPITSVGITFTTTLCSCSSCKLAALGSLPEVRKQLRP